MGDIRLVDGRYYIELYKGCILRFTREQLIVGWKAGKAWQRRKRFESRQSQASKERGS